MRYLLILLLSFLSISAFSQGIYNKAATNIKQNRLMADSVLGVPRDTSSTNNATFNGAPVGDSGRIAYQFGKFWGHDGSGWNLLGSQSFDINDWVRNQSSIVQTANYRINGNGLVGNTMTIGSSAYSGIAPLYVSTLPSYGNLSAFFEGNIQTVPAISDNHAVTRGQIYTREQSDTLYAKRRFSQIFPYDSMFYAPPSKIYNNQIGNVFEVFNIGNSARNSIPFQRTPIGIGRNNWSGLLTNNMILDTLAGPGWKLWNTNYPASCVEVGWEGVTFHYVPHGYSSFTQYPHEGLQIRGGVDGVVSHDADSQYIQAKTSIVARFDTAFDAGSTAYGWGYSRKPFTWFYSEYPTKQLGENVYSSFDQYYTGATSGPISAFMRSRGTYLSKTAVQTADTIGNISWYGYDGEKFLNNIRMYGVSTANAVTNNAPAKWTVSAGNGVTPGGSITTTAAGYNGINNTNPESVLHIVRQDFGGIVYLDRYNNTGTQLAPGFFGNAARGTIVSPSAVQAGDPLVSLGGGGHDGDILDRDPRGRVVISADGDWTTSHKPTRFDVSLTHTFNDIGPVLSVDRNGNTGVGGPEDATYKLTVAGNMKAAANSYASGGFSYLVRNSVTGAFETVASNTVAPASLSPNYVNVQTSTPQAGGFSMAASSFIVGPATTTFNIGQTGATSTNEAGLSIDGVDGNFTGVDYLALRQVKTGSGYLRNYNASSNFILGAGGTTSSNITLKPSNVTTFGGAVELPIVTVTGNLTLGATNYSVYCNNTANITINLPAAATCSGRIYVIKKISNNAFTISVDPNASENIEGSSTPYSITTYLQSITIQSDGTQWWIN